MRVKVITEFVDKLNRSNRFKPGTEADFDDVRAADVIARGLAVPVTVKAVETVANPVNEEAEAVSEASVEAVEKARIAPVEAKKAKRRSAE